jgi:hypothetical protein
MLEHDYSAVSVTEPTCENQGYTTYTCDCGAFYYANYTNALGHDYEYWYMYRDETTPIEGEGRRDCGREDCEHYDTHAASSGFTYSVNSDKTTCALTGKGACSDTELFLPFNIDGYDVTEIGGRLFDYYADYRKTITHLIIPNTVTTIGFSSFEGCSSLSNITIPDSVTSIGESAFQGCSTNHMDVHYLGDLNSWLEINLDAHQSSPMSSIGNLYFFEELVTSVKIPENISVIGPNCFDGWAQLQSVIMPDSIETIGKYAFANCKSLENINLSNSLIDIGAYAFWECDLLASIIIPDSVDIIGLYAFSSCDILENVNMADSVTQIDEGAFYECVALKTINLPSKITTINQGVFRGCISLKSIIIPNSIVSIEKEAFAYSGIQNVVLGNSIVNIGDRAFSNCCIETINIPNSVVNIGESAFTYCRLLKSIVISESVINVGKNAFNHCDSLENVSIPSSVETIGDGAFDQCDLLEYSKYGNAFYLGNDENPYVILLKTNQNIAMMNCNIHEDTKFIGNSAFKNCKYFKDVTIPNNVVYIGYGAFAGCKNLQNVTIPDSMTFIGDEAFDGCPKLQSINVSENNQHYKSIDGNLYTKDGKILIKYSSGKPDTSFVVPDSVETILKKAFVDCAYIENIVIYNSVVNVGKYAFLRCDSLTIFCEMFAKPNTWDSNWNYSNRPVVWGYTGE